MKFRKSTLKMLSNTWERSREYSRGRNGFHEYLDAVYNMFAKLGRQGAKRRQQAAR